MQLEESLITAKMASRKRSHIWIHFEEAGYQKAKCKICNNILSGYGGSTSNFRRHLESKHPTAQLTLVKEEDSWDSTSRSGCGATTTAASTGSGPDNPPSCRTDTVQRFQQLSAANLMRRPMGNLRQSMLDEEFVKMIALDFQPFSILEDKGFRAFTKALDPSYVLPNRKTLSTTLLPQMYSNIKAELMLKVRSASAVCLTTDCWTSLPATSFMAVTCHYIDENFSLLSSVLDCFSFTDKRTADDLAAELQRISEEWEIADKVVACVSDDATDIKAAIQKVGWMHLPCFAHTLNMIVGESLKHIQDIVTKVKNVIEYMHRSIVATQHLRATQEQMCLRELSLKQDVITRWNSTYYMLQRFLQQKDAVIDTFSMFNPSLPTLTADEWDILKDACEILRPFEEVTVEISGDRYVMASKIILISRGLQRVIQRLQHSLSDHGPVMAMVRSLASELQNCFQRVEYFTLWAEATLLDPRFKHRAFHDPAAADEAMKNVTAAARLSSSSQEDTAHASDSASPPPPQSSHASFWEDFDDRVGETVNVRNPMADAMTEMSGFLAEPLIPRSEDPLVWWKTRQMVYEGLTGAMKRRLCIVATSVPAERIFSKTGQIISERRNRLQGNNVRQLVFLNANLP